MSKVSTHGDADYMLTMPCWHSLQEAMSLLSGDVFSSSSYANYFPRNLTAAGHAAVQATLEPRHMQ